MRILMQIKKHNLRIEGLQKLVLGSDFREEYV